MSGETFPVQMSGTCKAALLAISAIVLLTVSALILAAVVDGFHEIPEGHVGVYYKYGALQEEISDPGIHFMQPFVTTFKSILIRPEEQTLPNMEAITKDGIEVEFKGISVLSRTRRSKVIYLIKEYGMDFKNVLIYNRIREDLRIFCANATIDDVYNEKFLDIVAKVKEDVEEQILNLGKDSVEILNLVIRKPDIPKDIAQNYKQVEVQWTEQLVAQQQKKTEEIKKETELLKAVADAERQKEVLEIKIQEQIIETEGKKNISDINNVIVREKQTNLADIAKYAEEQEALGNKDLYSPDYVKLKMAQSLSNNTKFFFSGKDSALGGLLSKLFSKKK